MRGLLLLSAVTACVSGIHAPPRRSVTAPRVQKELNAAKPLKPKPPGILKAAYSACGLGTAAAWTTVVVTTIRSNQPVGYMMPSVQHGIFARTSVLSAVPLIASAYATLVSASDSWEQLGSPTCRRLNLALATAGIGSALWVGFAKTLTQIPGTSPLLSHQNYGGATRAVLIGSYGAAAAMSAAVWARSLPEEVRKKPLSWPGRVADGVAQSLVSLAPTSKDDPVNVKYSILATSFLLLTANAFGPFPMAVVPSWTGRRCSRAFPAWTLLAAVSSLNLKEATESGKLLVDSSYRTLSAGLTGFGALYLSAKVGAIFLDPSFPVHYKIVTMVPAAQAAAAILIGLTLRPDK